MRLLNLPTTLLLYLLTTRTTALFTHDPPPLPLPPDFIHEGDAPYSTPNAKLRSALTCPLGTPTQNSKPILLIPSVGSSGLQSYLHTNYVTLLAERGFAPCYLDLPYLGAGDLQTNAAYIAYNAHLLSWLSHGNQVSVLAHGQSAASTQWALQFYPSTKHVVHSFVGLAPAISGIAGPHPEGACGIDPTSRELVCAPFVWQQAHGSRFFEALKHRYHVAQVPTVLIFSDTDDVVMPALENAELRGANTMSVQDLCSHRVVTHKEMLRDAAAFELVAHALTHGCGHAMARHNQPHAHTICSQKMAVGMTKYASAGKQDVLTTGTMLLEAPRLARESPVMEYALLHNQ